MTAIAVAGWICIVAGCSAPKDPAAASFGDGAAMDANWQKGPGRKPTPRTLYAMSRVLSAQGRHAEAATVLRRVVQAEPSFLPAYLDLAELHMRQQRPAAAAEVLAAALKVSPQDPVLQNDLGVAQLAAGRHAKALEAFEQALALAPGQARYQANAALALGMLGRYDEALEAYERVLPPAEAHHNVAVLCEARNDRDRATVERARSLVLRASQAQRPCGTHGAAAQARLEAEKQAAAATVPAVDSLHRQSSPTLTADGAPPDARDEQVAQVQDSPPAVEAAEPQAVPVSESEALVAAAIDWDSLSSLAEPSCPHENQPKGSSTGEIMDDAHQTPRAERCAWDALSHLADLVDPVVRDQPAR